MGFEELYASHKNLVFNLALQYVQNYEDAQEITQDVFVAIYQSLGSFKKDSAYTTWIYRITINKSLDHIKSRKRKKRFAMITSLFSGNSGDTSIGEFVFDHPGVQLEQKEALHNIFHCINHLPDNQKTALILSKLEHRSQGEIAEIMNLTPKAVESLVQRAKANLLKKLSSEGK